MPRTLSAHHVVPQTVGKKMNRRLSATGRFFRILLITSLHFKFKAVQEPTLWQLKEVNEKYKLVSRIDALWIPACMASFLWRNMDHEKLIRDILEGHVTIVQAVMSVMRHVPRIGHYVDMSSDIEIVVADNIKCEVVGCQVVK